MNALSDLAAEVKFRERMRGYDYEEVDNYVKTVSRVTAQARDRIAELEHRVDQLESQDGNDEGVTEIRETLLRTLVLAQRTADSAVSEARSEAQIDNRFRQGARRQDRLRSRDGSQRAPALR